MSRLLKVAVQMDPMDTVNINGDSTFALMLEAQRRGHAMWHYEVRNMSLQEGTAQPDGPRMERLLAHARPVHVQRVAGSHYRFDQAVTLGILADDSNRYVAATTIRPMPARRDLVGFMQCQMTFTGVGE